MGRVIVIHKKYYNEICLLFCHYIVSYYLLMYLCICAYKVETTMVVLTGNELSVLQEVMRYYILLQELWLLFSRIQLQCSGLDMVRPDVRVASFDFKNPTAVLWYWYGETWCKVLWRMFVLRILF